MNSKTTDNAVYLPAAKVRERYGVSDMTIWRWVADTNLGFPRPRYFGRLRFWSIGELETWEHRQPRQRRTEATK